MLIFEKSRPGRGCDLLPECDVEVTLPQEKDKREKKLHLPELSEIELSRHYTELAKKSHGVNDGFYPLGSCTMKYNPKINEDMAALPGFTEIHPLQPAHTVQGCLEVIKESENLLCEITGMDRMTFQPAAGAHGEFTGLLLIKAYHKSRGDEKRKKIIVPDSAHGTNPASAAMAGFQVVSIESAPDGGVDLEKLQEVCGEDTAGLMLTNPNTVGLFDKNILKITEIVHNCGGLCYYDGANLNAVMGTVRPGDMGFDVIHLNLHKTFSTPHGGGGPGSGPVGCKSMLVPFLPSYVVDGEEELKFVKEPQSIGEMKSFYGNFTVIVKALTYVKTLGREGIPEASQNAVLNANTEYYPIFEVPVSQMATGYDGAAENCVRDRNRIIAGTKSALVYYNDSQINEYLQFADTMKMDFAVTSPSKRFAILNYGTPVLYQPAKIVRIVNIGEEGL